MENIEDCFYDVQSEITIVAINFHCISIRAINEESLKNSRREILF